jgi:hypothetical protein
MPEEHPGRSGFHCRVRRCAIRRFVVLVLILASDSFDDCFIRVPGHSDELTQGRVRVGPLAQDDRPESRSQRILSFKGSVGYAQTLRRASALGRDHGFPHERVSDQALVSELQGVIERPVRPLHRTRQVRGILEDPAAEFRELAGEPEHVYPVRTPAHLAAPFDDRHLELDGTGHAQRAHQPVRFDVATMHAAKRRQYRDGAGPRQVAEQRPHIPRAGRRDSG